MVVMEKEYKFEDEHYLLLSKLQKWSAEKMTQFDDIHYQLECRNTINILTKIKQKQFYTSKERDWLNKLRNQYIIDNC
jgi:hypothetical protein